MLSKPLERRDSLAAGRESYTQVKTISAIALILFLCRPHPLQLKEENTYWLENWPLLKIIKYKNTLSQAG